MWIKGGEPSGQKTHKLVYLENFDKAPTQQYNQHACLKQKTKRISHVVCADAKGAAAWVTPSVNKNQLASIGKCICWHDILSFLKIMKYKLTEKDSWYVCISNRIRYILMVVYVPKHLGTFQGVHLPSNDHVLIFIVSYSLGFCAT